MSIINTTVIEHSGAGPATGTIAIDSTVGSDRMVLCLVSVKDTNPSAHSVTLDLGGTDEIAATVRTSLTEGVELALVDRWVAAYYILDADLPAVAGTFNIECSYGALLDDTIRMVVYYLESVTQESPELATIVEHINELGVIATTLTPSANADVFDIVNSTDIGTVAVYVPDTGQTSILNGAGNNKYMSSYADGTGETTMGWTRDPATQTANHLQLVVAVGTIIDPVATATFTAAGIGAKTGLDGQLFLGQDIGTRVSLRQYNASLESNASDEILISLIDFPTLINGDKLMLEVCDWTTSPTSLSRTGTCIADAVII